MSPINKKKLDLLRVNLDKLGKNQFNWTLTQKSQTEYGKIWFGRLLITKKETLKENKVTYYVEVISSLQTSRVFL